MNVVVVESPAKAKTINKYLGGGYTVLASYGHVRDLPSKDGSVLPGEDFAMNWEVDAKAGKHIKLIADALKGAQCLYLATDPDREGEAIAWHVREVLEQKKALKGVDVKRVVFNEITRSAVVEAFSHPRALDAELVEAYLARRALDYLVGFTLSPVLWRKLPGSRSAGRVQSVALRLICERETEIEIFRAREYWSVKALLKTPSGEVFEAQLTRLGDENIGKMTLGDEQAATAAAAAVANSTFAVADVQRKKTSRHPAPPFTTSTLQQEASRKLGFGAKRTMQVAQNLYEGITIGGETVGLITYMRTDGVQMASEAVSACRKLIGERYGAAYLPTAPRFYKSKAKNAQEAHEAIRPTDFSRLPKDIANRLNDDQRRLYELVWKRAMASQMESVVLDQVAADIIDSGGKATLRATGSTIAFDGFLKLYGESRDDAAGDDDDERTLPPLKEGDALSLEDILKDQHFTQPPPRYSEASLVKTLEKLGIGRPSTYASIISVLQDRDYVHLDKRRFIPEDRGRLVTAFLSSFFARYVEYNFTAELETKLDDISGGRVNWKQVLREFWESFSAAVGETKDLRVREVLDALDNLLGPHFFPEGEDGADSRKCPQCADGRLNLKLGKFGAFIGCSNYPECRHTRPLVVANGNNGSPEDSGPKELGLDPDGGLAVTLRKGPYGTYVQLGEPEGKTKPKRASLPRTMEPSSVDLDKALALLALPRDIGVYPETGKTIVAGIGRFGPYLKHNNIFISLKGDDDVLTVGLDRAISLIADSPKKIPPRELGTHPKDGKPVIQHKGRFGPYVQHGVVRATLPNGTDADAVTLEQALELIAAKAKKGGGKGGKKKPAAEKAVAEKPAPKKKKPAAKKAAA